MKIKLIGDFLPMGEYEQKLSELGEVDQYSSPSNQDELLEKAEGANVIITHDEFSEEVLNKLDDLEMIVSWTTGLSNIDLDAAESQGIKVKNIPEYCSRSVAEHALALTMTSLRNIPGAIEEVKEGSWDCMPYKGSELKNKKMGIVGYGKIGQILENLANNVGMETLVTNRSSTDHPNQVELDELLRKSDVVALTVSLNDSTERLIGEDELKKMKNSAHLVNVSRGKVVDQEALINAIEDEIIAGAAVDVLETEPEVPEKVVNTENLIVTPHIAWLTNESLDNGARTIYNHVESFLEDKE